jgi:hypothetical protein
MAVAVLGCSVVLAGGGLVVVVEEGRLYESDVRSELSDRS